MDTNLKDNNKKNNNKLTKHKKNIFSSLYNKFKSISANKRIVVISICISFLPILFGMFDSNKFVDEKDIFNDTETRNEIQHVCDVLNELNAYLEDSSGIIEETAINSEVKNIKEKNWSKLEESRQNFKDYKLENSIDDSKEEPSEGEYYYYKYYKVKVDEAEKEYNKSEEEYKEEATKNIKENVENMSSELKRYVNIEYYIQSTNGNIITNIFGRDEKDIVDNTRSNYNDFMTYSAFAYENTRISRSMKCFVDLMDTKNMNCEIVVIRISNPLKEGDYIYQRAIDCKEANINYNISRILIIIDILIIVLFSFVRKKDLDYNQNVIEKLYSKLFIEFKIMILIGIVISFRSIYEDNFGRFYYGDMLIQVVVYCTFVYFALSDIYRVLKNKEVKEDFANSFIKYVYITFMKEILNNQSVSYRLCVVAIIYGINILLDFLQANFNSRYFTDNDIALFVGIIFLNTLPYLYVALNIIDSNKIKEATSKIIEGNYNNDIKIRTSGTLKEISENIMNIEKGFSTAVEDAVKSEKMKTELITNVSHDLKTPLTSIINYVDLLSKDNTSEEERKKYLEVLNERSLRLKVLIEDLFEAAKATSGTIEYNFENLDPVALLRQSLGEFEEKIKNSNLTVIKNIPEKKLTIIADGKKTFRVIQNLLSNISKYSMKNSRVYIDVIEEEEYVLLVFKNMSANILNFTESEILERFKRGDSSRTTEGNGLGLSIAKSLTEGQGGLFKIIIDGDLFKVEVRIKKSIV